MDLADAAWDPRPDLAADRADLVALLGGLDPADWACPTEAGHWTVKDVALHVLDDDLGLLSRDRDGDRSGWLTPAGGLRGLVEALDARNKRWVEAGRGWSPRLIVELLTWAGDRLAEHLAAAGLDGNASVAWASDDLVPRWFDLARELTERWSHQRHVRDAVGQPGDHDRLLPEVLATFVWAFPHQLRVVATPGATVDLALGTRRWHLVGSADGWSLEDGPAPGGATARLAATGDTAWRLLTGLPTASDQVRVEGPEPLAAALLGVRGILV